MYTNTMAMLLAGGEGRRLSPLTLDRAKPAVPFGGRYRIIDIVLSNFVNSGISRINVLTQFKADSLIKHIHRGWVLESRFGRYIDIIPAQMRVSREWYKGSGDAVFQNLNLVRDEDPDYVLVFGADHIYKMDVSQMLQYHRRKRAELTIAAVPVPLDMASRFGVIQVDKEMRVVGFQEKPEKPAPIPGKPDMALVSMGNYVFNKDILIDAVTRDASDSSSANDFGKNIIPALVNAGSKVYVYNFQRNRIPGQPARARGYWVDVGTIDAYWEASMDLVGVTPIFNLYNHKWPLFSLNRDAAPAKFVFSNEKRKRIGIATDSLVSEGCVVSGSHVDKSILSPNVRVNSFCTIEQAILFNDVNIGRHCRLKNVIIDKEVRVPPRTVIGYDAEADRMRFTVTESGIVVIPKGFTF